MEEYIFNLTGEWYGGRTGQGRIQTNGLHSNISIGAEMSGSGIGTNPDELLISAVASCYLMTLGIGLDAKKYPYKTIKMSSKGIVSDEGGLHFKEIIHYPNIILERDASETLIKNIKTQAVQAEKDCMIAKALQGNVKVTTETKVTFEN